MPQEHAPLPNQASRQFKAQRDRIMIFLCSKAYKHAYPLDAHTYYPYIQVVGRWSAG